MKIKIKKFMELRDVEFSTPCEISGKNGQGKTTLIRAILYVLSGKDLDGSTFSENVYQFNPANASECFADVSIIHENRTFRKETSAKEIRVAGETESKIVKSINTKYYIDGAIVDKNSFENEIMKYTNGKSFQLFSNPSFFAGLKVDEKRAVFADFFDFKIFNSEIDVNQLRQAIKNAKQKEVELIAQIKGYTEAQKPEQVEDLREKLNDEILSLETEIKENSFSLQPAEIESNNKIYAEIEALKNDVFRTYEPLKLSQSLQFVALIDLTNERRSLNSLIESQIDTSTFDLKIAAAKSELQKFDSLKSQIENYENSQSTAKCSICPICTLAECPQKKTDLRSLSDLQFEFSLLNGSNLSEKVEILQNNLILYKAEKEAERAEKIKKLEEYITYSESLNKGIEKENQEIAIKNSVISAKNEEIEKQNIELKNQYENELLIYNEQKSKLIAELQDKIIIAKQSDNSERYQKITELRAKIAENQANLDNFNKLLGFYENSVNKVNELSQELSKIRVELSQKEREEIMYKDAELQFYTNLQEEINKVLPFGFSLKLFEKNKSNDNITLTFDLLFNQNLYFSNGQKTVAFAQLCKLFQTKSGIEFPIFIDESAILDEKNIQLILSLQNIILIRKSNEKLTIKNL